MADTKDVIVTGQEVATPVVLAAPLDETVEGGKYLSERGEFVDANGNPFKDKPKAK